MVLGKLPVPGRPTIWITVGQGPTALAVSAGGGCLDIFTLLYPLSLLSPSLWETARYRLKYCLKGPLNPKQQQQQFLYHSKGGGGGGEKRNSKEKQVNYFAHLRIRKAFQEKIHLNLLIIFLFEIANSCKICR